MAKKSNNNINWIPDGFITKPNEVFQGFHLSKESKEAIKRAVAFMAFGTVGYWWFAESKFRKKLQSKKTSKSKSKSNSKSSSSTSISNLDKNDNIFSSTSHKKKANSTRATQTTEGKKTSTYTQKPDYDQRKADFFSSLQGKITSEIANDNNASSNDMVDQISIGIVERLERDWDKANEDFRKMISRSTLKIDKAQNFFQNACSKLGPAELDNIIQDANITDANNNIITLEENTKINLCQNLESYCIDAFNDLS